jgi:transposase InsO family protein
LSTLAFPSTCVNPLAAHRDVLAAADFFTTELWTLKGLVTYYVLFFIDLASRKVHVAGLTPHPHQEWMKQIARNVTMEAWGFLSGSRFLLHDRDGKFCPAFRRLLESAGVRSLPLPVQSPDLNAFAERWLGSVKEECLSKLILFGEGSLRRALDQYVAHCHHERNHQGLGHVILEPLPEDRVGESYGRIRRRKRLGGLLRAMHRAAPAISWNVCPKDYWQLSQGARRTLRRMRRRPCLITAFCKRPSFWPE